MAKSKKPVKKAEPISVWRSGLSDVDRVFDNFRRDLEKSFTSFPEISFPRFPNIPETACDIADEGNQFRLTMDMPGIKKNEIDVNVTDNAIEVTGEHKEEEKKKNYLRKERHHVSYYQTIPLSEKVVPGKVKAKLTDGVLDVILPKEKPTKVSPKKSIKVQ
ncbi:MAG: Hsp20/alpha crystallin family protein [Nitrosopumilaceae archaeon]|jgi:HSP20 family protein